MIRVFTARSGAPTLTVDGVAIHSAYDPAREAERFVRDTLAAESPATVLVLGEGLGHVTAAARALLPGARIIPVFYSTDIVNASAPGPEPAWHPGASAGLAAWLRARLSDFDVDGLRVIEWPPSARVFPDLSRAANEQVRQVVQELNGSLVTSVATGRLWLRNTLVNLVTMDAPLTGRPCGEHRPVVIAASGPSLERAVDPLRASRTLFDLWALPSSCPLLEDAGLQPDLVVMTDPGYYSLYHLSFTRLRCPIAMPLSAARGSWELHPRDRPGPYVLSQPSFFESAALESVHLAAPGIAPHGTVASTAVDLALAATTAPVIVAGLDMCGRDLLSHGRPSAFDALLQLEAWRLQPHTSLLFHRAAQQRMTPLPTDPRFRASPALRVYAGWLDESSRAHPGRLFRLHPTPVSLGGMEPLDAEALRQLLLRSASSAASPALRAFDSFPSARARREIALHLLGQWELTVTCSEPPLSDAADTPETAATGFAICACIEPRMLLDTRRRKREGDSAGAAAAGQAMTGSVVAFLRRLGDRIRGAA